MRLLRAWPRRWKRARRRSKRKRRVQHQSKRTAFAPCQRFHARRAAAAVTAAATAAATTTAEAALKVGYEPRTACDTAPGQPASPGQSHSPAAAPSCRPCRHSWRSEQQLATGGGGAPARGMAPDAEAHRKCRTSQKPNCARAELPLIDVTIGNHARETQPRDGAPPPHHPPPPAAIAVRCPPPPQRSLRTGQPRSRTTAESTCSEARTPIQQSAGCRSRTRSARRTCPTCG